jgi:hypothetical protein
MVVLLAGRVAEHVVFGAITTGASDDLKRVYELSRAMIAEYGMGTTLMSRRLPADDYSVSDATRRLVDDEQQHLTDMAWRRALEVIVAHRPLLDALASTLLEQEVLLRSDIERVVAEARADADGIEAVDRQQGRVSGLPPGTSGAGRGSVAAVLPASPPSPASAPSPPPPEPDDDRS